MFFFLRLAIVPVVVAARLTPIRDLDRARTGLIRVRQDSMRLAVIAEAVL